MSSQNKTKKRDTESSWEYAYKSIKDKILSMEIKPGSILSENNISKELGVSRTPVREAFKQLEKEGLIQTSNKRRRVFVLTSEEVKDVFDIKISLEGSIARWAAERGSDQQREQLRTAVRNMRYFVEEDSSEESFHENLDAWLKLDNRFHALLFEMAGNARAERIIKNLNYQWHRFRIGILGIEWRIRTSLEEHEKIADAVINGKGTEAEAVMREHLEKLQGMIIHLMDTFHI